jgi:hypothetical protein
MSDFHRAIIKRHLLKNVLPTSFQIVHGKKVSFLHTHWVVPEPQEQKNSSPTVS